MKKLNVLSILLVCLFFVSTNTNATGLKKEFKNYEISEVEDLHLGKKVMAVWTLSYSNQESPVTVVKRKGTEGLEYVVSSKFFEVSYVSSTEGFGVRKVRNSWSNVSKSINNAVISQDEMKKQAVIPLQKVDDKAALGLIASYLPDLLNNGYTHLLN
jgi:hypothetical protein